MDNEKAPILKKAKATWGAGGGGVVLIWLAGMLGFDIPPEVAAIVAAALPAFFVWFKSEPLVQEYFELKRREQQQKLKGLQE